MVVSLVLDGIIWIKRIMSYTQYFAIETKLKKNGFKGDRHDLIMQFTDDLKSGLSDLTPHEYLNFIIWLNQSFESLTNAPKKEVDPLAELCNKMRRKIIALFHKMDYRKPDGKIDMEHVNEWCVKYGHKHVPLNDYNYNELTKLLTQAENYYKTHIAGI